MPIEVWSINKRRDVAKAAADEERLLGWLRCLSSTSTKIPDVLCLQDFRVELATHLSRLPELAFAAMTDHLITSADGTLVNDRQLVGIAIASRYKLSNRFKPFTWGDGIIRPLQGVAHNDRFRADSSGDDEIDHSEARRFIAATVQYGEEQYRIGTAHGFWVRAGVPNARQRQSTERLAEHAAADAKKHGGLVVFADWNLDKDGDVDRILRASGAREQVLPEGVRTTMSTKIGEHLGLKPDRIFQWPDAKGNYRYEVSDIYLSDAPGSDHLMLCGTVSLAA